MANKRMTTMQVSRRIPVALPLTIWAAAGVWTAVSLAWRVEVAAQNPTTAPAEQEAAPPEKTEAELLKEIDEAMADPEFVRQHSQEEREQAEEERRQAELERRQAEEQQRRQSDQQYRSGPRVRPVTPPPVNPITASRPSGMSPATQPSIRRPPRVRPEPVNSPVKPVEPPPDEAPAPEGMRLDGRRLPTVDQNELDALENEIKANPPATPPPAQPGVPGQGRSFQPGGPGGRAVQPGVQPGHPTTSSPAGGHTGPGTTGAMFRGPSSRPAGVPVTPGASPTTPGVHAPVTGVPGSQPASAIGGVPGPTSNAPKDATIPRHPLTGAPNLAAELKKQTGWWTLPYNERPYFFAWKNASFEDMCRDLQTMTGLSMLGQGSLDVKAPKPITFESVKIMKYDEALLQFNQIIFDLDAWVIQRDSYLEIRRLTEWYRHIPPKRIYRTEKDYEAAKLPDWEMASVSYEPKQQPAQMLAERAVDLVPVNAARATTVPNSNAIELKGFVYFLNQQLEYLHLIDVDTEGDGRELRVYSLKYASSQDAAQDLRQILPPTEGGVSITNAPPSAGGGRRGGPPGAAPPAPAPAPVVAVSSADMVDINEDSRLNRLLIRATPSKHKLVAEYLEKFIDLPLEKIGQLEVIKLEHTSPTKLAEMIRPMLGEQKIIEVPQPAAQPGQPPPPRQPPRVINVGTTAVLTPLEQSRSILVKAKSDEMVRVKEFIELLDVPADEEAYQYIVLKHGSASNIAGILSTTFSSRGSSGGRGYGGGGSQDTDFRAIPDVANDRALILMGNKKDLDDAVKLIAKLDVDPEAGTVEHLVRLKHATPTDMAMTLMSRFGEKSGGGGGYSGYGYSGRGYRGGGMSSGEGGLPKFISDDSSKTLIVVSTPEMWMDIERVMKELDTSADVDKTTKLYKLKHAGAGNVSQILTESFGGGGGRSRWGMGYGGGESADAKFRFDPQTNVVIVSANDEIHEKVAALILQLDQPSAADQAELRAIQLKTAEAAYVIEKLEDLFPDSGGGRRGGRRGGFGDFGMYGMGMSDSAPKVPILLVAEPVSNRILITSSEEDFKKAEKYAKEIDDLYAAQEFVRKTFVLQQPPAEEVRSAIETMFTSGGGGDRRRWWDSSSSSSTPGSIKMTEVGNGLVISAPKDKMAEIEKFIALLDTNPSGKNEIRSYKVESSDYQGTSEIARNLEQLYSVGTRGDGWGRRGSRDGVKFIGSYNSDILMVSAPPEKMAEIDPIVQQMIKQNGPDTSMVIRHYDLKDARPDDIADMLEPILQAKFQELKEKGGGRRGGGWYGGFGGMSDGPRVTAHRAGRRIMVSAPESLLPLVDELLKEFDRPAEPSTMRMITLKTARAEEIAEIVEEQVNKSSGGGSRWGGRRGRDGWRGEWSPWGGGMMSRSSGSSDTEQLSATAVESSNMIILRGPNDKVAEGERLVLSLDAQAKPEGPVLRVFALQYADLYEVVSALEDIAGASEAGGSGYSSSDYDYSSVGYGGSGSRRRSRGSTPVVIQTEYASKRIIVSAPQDKFPLIEEIIKMKEELAKPTEDTHTSRMGTVVTSRKGNITKVYDVEGSAETLAKYLDRVLIDLIGYSDSPYVKSFPIANQVIVEGKPEHFTLVEEWLIRLQKQKIRAPVTMSVKQVPKGTNVARMVEMMQQAAPAEMQNKFKVSAIPKAAGRKNPLDMLHEINYTDPIVEPDYRSTTQPAAPVSVPGVRTTSLNNAPVVAPTSELRALTDSIARFAWAGAVKITVAEPATQPTTAASSQPAATPAPATQPAATPAPAPKPAATAPVPQPAAPGPQPVAASPATQPAAAAPTPVAPPPATAAPAPQPAAPVPQPVTAPPPPVPAPTPVTPAPAAPAAEDHEKTPRGSQGVEARLPSPAPDSAANAPTESEMSAEERTKIEIGRAAAEAYQTGNVQVKYDEESGLIYFLGDPSAVQELQDTLDRIIENFEELQEAPSDVRVFRLRYLDVSIAATILEQMFNDKQPAQPKKAAQPDARKPQAGGAKDKKNEEEDEEGGGKRRRDEEQARKEAEQAQAAPGGQRVRIFPNPRDQTLIVRAAKEDFQPVAELLLKIDRPSDKPPVDIKIFQLKKLNAYEVEQAIKAILKIEDTRTRTLRTRPSMMRAGMPGMMGNADALIEQLEQEMLEMQASGMLGGDAATPGAEGDVKGKLKLNPAKEITITSDGTTNSIIVSAPQDGMKLVEKLIDNLEAQDIPSQIKTFPLKYGDAEKVATELQRIFRADGGGGGGGGGRMGAGGGEVIRPSRMGAVTVAADARTNTLVVRALLPDMEKVEPIITKLDVAPDKGQAQIYTLEHADATTTAETLRAVHVDDPKATGSLAIRITPNAETNSIVVWAPDAQQKLIAEQIKQLDDEVGQDVKPHQIQLKVANASTVADKLKEIFLGSRTGAGGARGKGGKQRITIVGEDSSKMLFVSAPAAVFEEIKGLAETMDKTTTSDIQVFKLKYATAQEVLSRFKEMMIQVTRSGGGAIASDVYAVTADERTNSLIVAGTPATFLAVTKVLTDLDAPPPDVTTVTTQMFTLVRGQATSVAATINALHSGKQFVHGMLPPRAAAEATANVVYVTGTKAQIDEIKNKIIDPLEGAIPQPPAAITVNDYQIPLKFANADDVAETLDKMFTKRFAALKTSGATIAPAETSVSITPEPSTKRLLVTCSANNKKAIDDLLVALDVEGATPRGQQTKVIPVKVADLAYTVQALTATFGKTGTRVPANEQVTIAAEYGTQSIIIKAPVAEMEQITKLLEQIDNPDANKINPPETVRVQHVKASDMAKVLTDMIARTKRPDRNTRQYPVTVTADDSSDTLLLTANTPKDMDEIKAMIKQLDSQPAPGTERVVKSYPLRYADLTSMTTAITARFKDNEKRPIKDQVTLTPDASNMALMVSASAANHEKVAQIIKELDVSNFDKVAAPKIVRLKFAKASEVATTMNAMVQRSKKRDQKTSMYPITVQGDDSTNTLIVTANETDMKEAETLITQLDIEPPTETDRVVKSYPLQYADLQSTTTAITARFKDNEKRPIHDQVTLTPDYVNMALMVTASPKNHEKVTAIIKELDISNVGRVVIPKTVVLKHAKASDVATTMNGMIQRSKKRDQKTGLYPITAAANDSSNTLVITANETDMKEAEVLIAQLDIEPPTDKDRTVKPYPLQYAELQSVVTAITARFSNNANRPIQDQVTFTADVTNNALLVTASLENHERVAKIVAELDTAEIKGARLTAPETVMIKNVLPSELAKTLDKMIRASMKVDRRTGTYPVTVSSNDASGALLVTANNDESMKEIKALIAQLDIPQVGETQRSIKTYPIQYVDLTAMQKVIDARFEANKTLSQRDQVVTSVEPATSTLVVTASEENHEKIAALIKEMDVSGTGVPHQEILRLKNARAADLYPVLQATYRTKGRAGQQPPAFGADTNSNSIVVSANKQDMAAIKELVAELDKPVDEANVEELRVIVLEFIDAAETQKIMSEYLRKPGTTAGRGSEDLVGGVRIQASPLMNALVVSGSASSIDRVQKVVQNMDKEMPGAGTAPKIIPIKNGSAAQLATTLSRMFTEPAEKNRTRTSGTDTIPLIMADDGTNSLVVRARTVDYKMIEEMAGKLDTKTEMSGMEVVQLPRGMNARQLASEIEKTVNTGEQAKQRQQPGYKPGQIAIGVDERVPALMVAGTPSLFPTVKQLVDKLQEMKPTSGMSARVVRPVNIAPQDMKKVLDQLIEQQRSGGQKTGYGR